MKRVLIVDDELFVRKGLRSLIDWESCGFKVIGDCDNGEDALEVIKRLNPDLVITDIRMPILNGLELIKTVIETPIVSAPKFIIISGYNDFSYAQNAIRYGVKDFILKPIDKDEMEEALLKLAQSLVTEERHIQRQEHSNTQSMFKDLLSGNTSAEMLDTYLTRLNASKSDHFYYVMMEIFNTNASDPINEDDRLSEAIRMAFKEAIEFARPIQLHQLQGGKYGLIIPSTMFTKKLNHIEQFLNRIAEVMSETINRKIMLFVGAPTSDLSKIKISYDTAIQTSLYKYASHKGKVLLYEKVKFTPIQFTELDQQYYSFLFEKIDENNHVAIESAVDSMFIEFTEKVVAPQAIKSSLMYCINKIISILKTMDSDASAIQSYEALIQWEQSNFTLTEIKEHFKKFILESAQLIIHIRKEHAKGDIHKIKTYIERHYNENLSLKSIATTFYMNPVYMGQLFKKTYGVYFKDFLLDLRINEAKKLLRQTNLRIYEIGDKIGFRSTDYFVTQFEKTEGQTPTEYRNGILK